ncbi:MAG: TonB-dependent receptor domain-containing protein, partial [Candidatus Zixiibacteriota bacterium]
MKLKLFFLTCILLFLWTGAVFGAVVGKITGVITDVETQQPLVGVSVAVQGTSWGAITDADGRYNILNVSVGTYTLIISTVGYATVEVSNVGVHSDLASYQDLAMTPEVTELGTVISVTAESPLVIKDKTTSVNIIKQDQIRALPTRGYEQVVGIQNSVVRMISNPDVRQRGGRESIGTAPELNLRGGRPSEVAYYVDGFSQQDPLSGLSTANISNNAIKEISVTSGAFSAEYGHVSSGIVNVVTNSGSNKYHGNIELISDNFASDIKRVYDNNYYAADVGGPIPGLEKGYFFFSGERRWLKDRSPSSKSFDIFEANNLPYANIMPHNSLSGWSYQGKIDYNFSANTKLALNGNGSLDNWQEYRHSYLFDINHSPRYEDENLGLNAKLTHTFNASTFINLSTTYFVTERKRGDGVIFDNLDGYLRTVNGVKVSNPRHQQYNSLFWADSGFVQASQVDTSIAQGDPDDTTIFIGGHYWDDYLHRKSSYIGFRGDITSQVSTSHTLKSGVEFQRHTLRYYRNLRPAEGYQVVNIDRYGYDIFGDESDTLSFRNEAKNPINFAAYLQDRFEWHSLVINAGVRFDFFDYKAKRFKNLERPLDPDSLAPNGDDPLDESDLEDSEKFTRVSPRLGIAFPVSDKTQMHINYGKFFQRPDLVRLYSGYDFTETRLRTGGFFYPFGNPNLEPEETTQYEFGFTHKLGDNTAFDVTAYYKDVRGLIQVNHHTGSPLEYDLYQNSDFGTIKGVDFTMTMRRTKNISLNMKYTLAYATGTGSYANTQRNIA